MPQNGPSEVTMENFHVKQSKSNKTAPLFRPLVKNRVRPSDRLDWQEASAGGWNQGALAGGGDFAWPAQGLHPAAAEPVRRRPLHARGAEPERVPRLSAGNA